MKTYPEEKLVRIEREGDPMVIPFCEIEAGDLVLCINRYVQDDAHESGDASYSGWLFYDTAGESWFPEDID